jgi:hypothetical protein
MSMPLVMFTMPPPGFRLNHSGVNRPAGKRPV